MSAPSSTPIDPAPAVRAEGLAKMFGGVRALDGVDLSVSPGELVALIGENGSGKSTMLKILFGIVESDAGSARVLGLDPRRDQSLLRPRLGYVGQDSALDPEMKGWEILRLFYALRGLPHPQRNGRLERIVEGYGLGAFCDRPVGGYSGGERQRLHLALETMHDPSLILLDEPTSSLDPAGRRSLWGRLAAWRDAGRTVLVATHDLADVAPRCDRAVLLRSGRVVVDDTPAAIVAAHGRARCTITLARPAGEDELEELRRGLEALGGDPEMSVDEVTLTLWRDRNPEGEEPALALLAGLGIHQIRFERQEPDLPGAFFRLTGGSPVVVGERRGGGRGGGGGGRGGGGRGGGRGGS